jgi:hypothetical protein
MTRRDFSRAFPEGPAPASMDGPDAGKPDTLIRKPKIARVGLVPAPMMHVAPRVTARWHGQRPTALMSRSAKALRRSLSGAKGH